MEDQVTDGVNGRAIWVQAVAISLAVHVAVVWAMAFSSAEDDVAPSAPPASAAVADGEESVVPQAERERADTATAQAGTDNPSGDEGAMATSPSALAHGRQVPTVAAASATATKEYVVKAGDNLSSIARRHGCTMAELVDLNKSTVKKLSHLMIGQKLLVPTD